MKEKVAQKNQRFTATAIIFLVVSLFLPRLGSALTCTWRTSGDVPPAATSLRSYRDFFHAPARVAVDSAGNLYATDSQTGQAFVRDEYGRLISVMQGFASPLGMAVDNAGRIYVGEQGNGRVAIYDQQWNFLAVLGQGEGEFVIPNDIALDPQSDWIYVSDSGANTIKVYSADGALLFSFGGKGTAAGQFDFPAGLYINPAGDLFVADQNNDRIQILDRSGNFLGCIGSGSLSSFSRKFGRIQGITGDLQGRLYVADAFQGYVQVFDPLGYSLSTIGSFGDGPGQLRTPMGVAIDSHNRLFVGSANNARVEVFGLDAFSDPHMVQAVVDIQPDPWNRFASPDTITVYIEMRGEPLDQINIASITASDVAALGSPVIGDYNANGIPDLMVTFDARSILATIPDGDPIIIVSGAFLNGNPFEGSDTVRVFSQPMPAVVDIQPDTLKRSANRDSITAYIEIGSESLEQVDPASITANGVRALLSSVNVGDYDADGIPDLTVKFDAQSILATLPNGDSAIVVSGSFLNGNRFEGSDTVRVR